MSGRFVVLEGIEGVGKSTQLKHAHAHLVSQGIEVVVTREPGGTPLAERIREIVIAPAGTESVPPSAELLLMFAARAVHVENLIRPSLARGAWVLCDRFVDATHAYQGAGRGVPEDQIVALEHSVLQGLVPDLVVVLDAPVEVALGRVRARHGAPDRFEQEQLGFFNRVRARYLKRAHANPGRYAVVDASHDLEAVRVAVVAALDAALVRWRLR